MAKKHHSRHTIGAMDLLTGLVILIMLATAIWMDCHNDEWKDILPKIERIEHPE